MSVGTQRIFVVLAFVFAACGRSVAPDAHAPDAASDVNSEGGFHECIHRICALPDTCVAVALTDGGSAATCYPATAGCSAEGCASGRSECPCTACDALLCPAGTRCDSKIDVGGAITLRCR